MKSKYILVIVVIACGLGYFIYASSNNNGSSPSSIIDPNTVIDIISNVEWSISITTDHKAKDYDGNYWWIPDINWNHGVDNETYIIKETNKLKISRVKVYMRYSC